MRADWTASGDFTSGSTARPSGGTQPAFGFAAATNTTVRRGPKARQRIAAFQLSEWRNTMSVRTLATIAIISLTTWQAANAQSEKNRSEERRVGKECRSR